MALSDVGGDVSLDASDAPADPQTPLLGEGPGKPAPLPSSPPFHTPVVENPPPVQTPPPTTGAAFMAGQRDPEKWAAAMQVAERYGVSPDFAYRNYDSLSTHAAQSDAASGMAAKSPTFVSWLTDPDNATLAQKELEPLGKVDAGVKALGEPGADGFFGQMGTASATGIAGLGVVGGMLAAAYGHQLFGPLGPDGKPSPGSPATATIASHAAFVADMATRERDLRAQAPDYATEFDQAMAAHGGDVDKAYAALVTSQPAQRRSGIIGALQAHLAAEYDPAVNARTATLVGDVLSEIGAAASRPRGLAYQGIESLASMIPLIAGAAGGTAAAGPAGGLAGGFVGMGLTNVGQEISAELQRQKIDITNPADLERAFADPALMQRIRGSAERGGITNAAVSTLAMALAGPAVAKVEGAVGGVAGKVAGKAAGAVVTAGGMGAGQAAGQAAEGQAPSAGQAISTAISMLGVGAVTEGIGAGREALHPDPVEAAAELTKQAGADLAAHRDAQVLTEIGQAVKAAPTTASVPERLRDLVETAAGGRDAKTVYFQADDWDRHWQGTDVSPAHAAEELTGDASAYTDAKANGTPLAIPLGDYIAKLGPTVHWDALLPSARLDPNGPSLDEAKEHLATVPATMKALADEVAAQAQAPAPATDAFHDSVKQQLVAAGRTPTEAASEAAAAAGQYRALAAHSGMTPEAMLERFPLSVGRGEAGGEGMEQPAYHGSPHEFDKFELNKIGTGEGAQSYGWGLYFAGKKDVAQVYREALSSESITVDGKDAGPIDSSTPEGWALSTVSAQGVDRTIARAHEMIEELRDQHEAGDLPEKGLAHGIAHLHERIAAAEALRGKAVERKPGGRLYTADIPDDEGMINHDQPLARQPEAVKQIVRAILKEQKYLRPSDDGPRQLTSAFRAYLQDHGGMASGDTGGSVYDMLAREAKERALLPHPTPEGALSATVGEDGFDVRDEQGRMYGTYYGETPEGAVRQAAEKGPTQSADPVYRREMSAEEEASRYLASKGVPGIKYLDEGSRAAGKGTHNYVLFDDSRIQIRSFEQSARPLDEQYPRAGPMVDGREVGDHIPNLSSIEASLSHYEEVPGIREIPMSHLAARGAEDYAAADDQARVHALAEAIRSSGRIDPLIVAVDKDGPYVIEGGHRLSALKELGATSFPAKVVEESGARYIPTTGSPDRAAQEKAAAVPAQVKTPEFKQWFGESKVVDATGSPLVVYHGTAEAGLEGGAFDTKRLGSVTKSKSARAGFFFVPDRDVAEGYSRFANEKPVADLIEQSQRAERRGQWDQANELLAQAERLEATARPKENVVAAYLSIERPYEFDAQGERFLDIEGDIHEAIAKAKVGGYDGLVLRNLVDNADYGSGRETDHWVAFDPAQIKSATDNAGTFDRGRASIYDQGSASGGPRGRISFGDHSVRIDLLANADKSTFIHELGHLYTHMLTDLASEPLATDQIRGDLATLRKWAGAEGDAPLTREQHETIARGYEAYMMEGRAPSPALRQAFYRFKNWLTSIYKTIGALGVELTPEVRVVFDRSLATDEEIDAAQRRNQATPLFPDPRAVGMSDETALRYTHAIDAAREAAESTLRVQAMRGIRREDSAQWKAWRAPIEAEVTTQVDAEPVYRALADLQKPEGVKLSRGAIAAEYGDLVLNGLPRGVASRESGVPPDVAAELYGFGSGRELVDALRAAPNRAQAIRERVASRMQAEHGERMTDAEVTQRADEAVRGDLQSRVNRLEIEHLASEDYAKFAGLAKAVLRPAPPDATLKAQAETAIGAKPVRALKPELYRQAAAKAAKEAREAFFKGDLPGTMAAKERERMATASAQVATAKAADVDAAQALFKKVFGKDADIAKSRDDGLVNAARAVLAGVGFGHESSPAADFLRGIRQYDPERADALQEIVDDATPDRTVADYHDLTVDEFGAVHEAVQALWDQARRDRQVILDGKRVDRLEVQGQLGERAVALSSGADSPGTSARVTGWEKTKTWMLSTVAFQRKVEHWVRAFDGGGEGIGRRALWNGISQAADAFRVQRAEVWKEYADFVRGLDMPITAGKIAAPEIDYTFAGHNELLHALAHTGNDSNFRKLLVGRKWGTVDEQGDLDTSRWDGMIARMQRDGTLTKAHYDYVQGVWDRFDGLKPGAQAAFHDRFGYYFSEITAKPFQNTFGQYAGGYVPALVDPNMVADAAARADRDMLEGSNSAFAFPSPSRGFTKKRVETYAKPLLLDASALPQSFDGVLRFTHLAGPTADVARMLTSPALRDQLAGLNPTIVSDMLMPWLNRAAQQRGESIQDGGQFWRGANKIAGFIRTNAMTQILTMNTTVLAEQIAHAPSALARLPAIGMARSTLQYLFHSKQLGADIGEMSPMMRERQGTVLLDARGAADRVLLQPNALQTGRDWINEHASFLSDGVQSVMDHVVWSTAYDQAHGEGREEDAARRYADSQVRELLGSGNPEDVSKAEAGTQIQKLFTTFYSFFNTKANVQQTELSIAKQAGLPAGAARLAGALIFGFTVPAMLGLGIRNKMHTGNWMGKQTDDEEGELHTLLRFFGQSQFEMGAREVPFGGAALEALQTAILKGKPPESLINAPTIDITGQAAVAPFAIAKALGQDATEAQRRAALTDFFTLLGMATGTPARPIATAINAATREP